MEIIKNTIIGLSVLVLGTGAAIGLGYLVSRVGFEVFMIICFTAITLITSYHIGRLWAEKGNNE